MLYTTPLVAQLIGEEPWLGVALKNGILLLKPAIFDRVSITTPEIAPRQTELAKAVETELTEWTEFNSENSVNSVCFVQDFVGLTRVE